MVRGPVRRVGHAPGDHADRRDEFESREMCTEAVVPATAEGQHRWRSFPG
jgi:hypothetical protein